MRRLFAIILLLLPGCASTPSNSSTIELLKNPATREMGLVRLEQDMNGLPPEKRQEMIRFMLRDPNLRWIGMRFVWADASGRRIYTGPCAFDQERANDDTECGGRSAVARPGGY